MGRKRIIPLAAPEKTLLLGKWLAPHLPSSAILALSGDLGAGKTTFVQGLALGLEIEEPIPSPTFTYLNLYQGIRSLFHFDLYRMKTSADFLGLGFEEYFEREGICAIEWPERIWELLPPHTLSIDFAHGDSNRIATFSAQETFPFPENLLDSIPILRTNSWD